MRQVPLRFIKDPLLRRLGVALGSLRQAKNELRWMKQELPREKLRTAVDLRRKQYPLQYLLGSQPFGALDIKCAPGVLIPRWETEEWVAALAQELSNYDLPDPPRILDLCTGTGCVLFGLCNSVTGATGIGADISATAIDLFTENQMQLGFSQRTRVIGHDIFQSLPDNARRVDCVTANPPYITDRASMEASVRKFEPQLALLEPSEEIWAALVCRVLETDAKIAVFEVGYKSQIDKCAQLFAQHGWKSEARKDGAGNWRTIWAWRNQPTNQQTNK